MAALPYVCASQSALDWTEQLTGTAELRRGATTGAVGLALAQKFNKLNCCIPALPYACQLISARFFLPKNETLSNILRLFFRMLLNFFSIFLRKISKNIQKHSQKKPQNLLKEFQFQTTKI